MRKLLFCCTAAMLAATTAAAETNLAPMLEADVTVPNGGILRLFPRVTMKGKTQRELVKTFDESPYKDVQPLRNMRYTWNRLERGKGEYLFGKELEPLFVQCVKEHSRVTPASSIGARFVSAAAVVAASIAAATSVATFRPHFVKDFLIISFCLFSMGEYYITLPG